MDYTDLKSTESLKFQDLGRDDAPTPDTRFSINSVRVDGVSHSAVAEAIVPQGFHELSKLDALDPRTAHTP